MRHLFRNDYSEICHPAILRAIERVMDEQNVGYGLDRHSEQAAMRIRDVFGCPQADVHFLVGGTQTNMTMISSALRDFEAVVAVDTGHINVHETGAIEGSGHKVVAVQGSDGKLYPDDVERVLHRHEDEHWVKPRMVYISNSTEIGTVYTKRELEELYRFCQSHDLLLFIDGARLGVALTSEANDLKPQELSRLCDAFYIGGTKNGLMYGEALVLLNPTLKPHFRWQIKHKGAMLAKGYLTGIQFDEVFRDGLYFQLAQNANDRAKEIYQGLKSLGISVDYSPTNQLFSKMKKSDALRVSREFGCEVWEDLGDEAIIRFVTSFATTKQHVGELLEYFSES